MYRSCMEKALMDMQIKYEEGFHVALEQMVKLCTIDKTYKAEFQLQPFLVTTILFNL